MLFFNSCLRFSPIALRGYFACIYQGHRPGGSQCHEHPQSLPVPLQTVLLLVASNVFMTFAWYGHLKNLATSPWYVAALASWGIALFEYLLQVPANRIGFTQFDVGQLKIIQEVITLSVFVPLPCSIWGSRSSGTTSGLGCAWWVRCISFSQCLIPAISSVRFVAGTAENVRLNSR